MSSYRRDSICISDHDKNWIVYQTTFILDLNYNVFCKHKQSLFDFYAIFTILLLTMWMMLASDVLENGITANVKSRFLCICVSVPLWRILVAISVTDNGELFVVLHAFLMHFNALYPTNCFIRSESKPLSNGMEVVTSTNAYTDILKLPSIIQNTYLK